MKRTWLVIPVLVSACGGATPTRPAVHPRSAKSLTWSVAWERASGLGDFFSTPLFDADGGITSGAARFDESGRYLGLLDAHVGGGRMITDVRALLPRGAALVSTRSDPEELMVVRVNEPPEKARARARLSVGALDAEGDRVAVHTRDAVVILDTSLTEKERTKLPFEVSYDAPAIAFVPGGMAWSAPASSCTERCDKVALVVRDTAGERRFFDGKAERIAFSPAGDAAAVWIDERIEVIALPSGASLGGVDVAADANAGPLAVANHGDALAALACDRFVVFDHRGEGYSLGYEGPLEVPDDGRDACFTALGLSFSPAGDRLALAGEDLTVLVRTRAGDPPRPAYVPRPPAGFEPRERTRGLGHHSTGTGLAGSPRLVATYEYEHGDEYLHVEATARDASEFAHIDGLAVWAGSILLRYEPMLRDETRPNRFRRIDRDVIPYKRAFFDARGRRNLEYAVFIYDGCDPSERYVRWVEDGPHLFEISIEGPPGSDPKLVRAAMKGFFDRSYGPGPGKRVLAARSRDHGPC
jgi:hypothetical protein